MLVERLKFLARDAAVYGLAGALNKALALITFPLLARHFSMDDYGVIDLLNTLLVLITTLLVFGQDSAVARYFFEDTSDVYRRQVASQSLALQAGVVLCALPVMWMSAQQFAPALSGRAEGDVVFKLMLLQAPGFLSVNFSQGILKWTFKRWKFLFISVGSTVATLIGLAVAIGVFRLDIVGVFAIYLIVRTLFGLVGLWFIRKWLRLPSGVDRLKDLVRFAWPYGTICVLSAAMPVLERGVIMGMLGPRELGLYAVGAKVATLISLPINAFETAWSPFALSIHKQKGADKTYSVVLETYALLVLACVLGLTAFAGPIIRVLGSARYEDGVFVVFALCMGAAIQAIGAITESGIMFSKKSYLKLYGYGAMVFFAFVSVPALTRVFGIGGAAWAAMCSLLVRSFMEGWMAQRAHPIDWNYNVPLLLGLFTMAVGALHQATLGSFDVAGVSLVPLCGLMLLLAFRWHSLYTAYSVLLQRS